MAVEAAAAPGGGGPENIVTGVSHSEQGAVQGNNNSSSAPASAPLQSVGSGVYGYSLSNAGVIGEGHEGVFGWGAKNGVHGQSHSATDSGVWGENTGGGFGVSGSTKVDKLGKDAPAGVWGDNKAAGIGVKGTSTGGDGVFGYSSSPSHAGVSGQNDSGGFGVWAKGTLAGHFEGDVTISSTLTVDKDVILSAAQDCAEDFDIGTADEVEPGTVMVLDERGALQPNDRAYDKRVAGVISGAGDFKPGLILGRIAADQKRMPLALVGKVFCKVDAGYAPIAVGDLLTTSPTRGHAMKAGDPHQAFGAVIGKSLQALQSGRGLVPILVALQ